MTDCMEAPGACGRSSASLCEPATKRMQPFSSVASDTASQQVAVAVSAVKGGQYAMSWCLQAAHSHPAGRRQTADLPLQAVGALAP